MQYDIYLNINNYVKSQGGEVFSTLNIISIIFTLIGSPPSRTPAAELPVIFYTKSFLFLLSSFSPFKIFCLQHLTHHVGLKTTPGCLYQAVTHQSERTRHGHCIRCTSFEEGKAE